MIMLVGFTFDLRQEYLDMGYSEEDTAEFDSPITINAVTETLSQLGFEVDRIGHARTLSKRLARGNRWDFVFNICEGIGGYSRESQVQSLLESHGIPYTFSDPVVTMHTLHKATAKSIVHMAGGRTPEYLVIDSSCSLDNVDLQYPLFAKPIAEGTGKGIDSKSIVRNRSELEAVIPVLLAKFKQAVLLETYLPGREFTVGVVGTGDKARCIGMMEIVLNDKAEKGVYSFVNKEFWEELVAYRPLAAEPELRKELEKQTLLAWRALGCRDGGRVDLRLDTKGQPHFLEVNPMAGLNPNHSDLPILCSFEGIGYNELIRDIVVHTLERVQNSQSTIKMLSELTFRMVQPIVSTHQTLSAHTCSENIINSI
jgi:D-alanine-D-alanine ligase